LGAAVRDEPNVWNHVIVAHHVDEHGTFWGMEGRPGGVGPVDLTPWLRNPWTLTNAAQPKTVGQRNEIALAVAAADQRPYDWVGIAVDAGRAVAPLWKMRDCWGPGIPCHVVCSSLADWAYERVGLASPAADRFCTPADWAGFVETRGWEP
jgi:hypothetical protein